MSLPAKLHVIINENKGIVTTAQANEAGVSNERLRLLVRSGDLERANYGVYILPGEFVDKMYIAQLRRSKIIFSHETALFLHDLTDRDPINYTVTVPTGYRSASLKTEGFTVYSIKKELHELGATSLTTMFGNTVTVYGMERTICDCIRSRNQLDIAIMTDAIKRYVKRKERDLNALMKMAELFHVDKMIRRYLEVLT